MTTSSIAGTRFLADAQAPVLSNVRISYGNRIDKIEPAGEQNPATDTLILPPFSNAHDHGRGLRPLAYGAFDAALEAWVPATYVTPPTSPYLVAAAAFARMARSGIANIVHCHLSRAPDALLAEARDVKRAAEDIGVRVAFVVPLRDRNRLVYGPDEGLLSLMAPEDAKRVADTWLRPIPTIAEQISNALRIAVECDSENFKVQLGPTGPERCSSTLLAAVAEASQSTGMRMHMHLLESKYQREWADVEYPQGIIRHLADIGLLSPKLTVAHGVWLRPDECDLLAQHGVTVSVNTSSNLRLRSGIAPVESFRAAKARFALGLDALAIDDDDDILKEMRLAYLLHRKLGFDEGLNWREVLAAVTQRGAISASVDDSPGKIAVGGPADMLVLNFGEMARDLSEGLYDPMDILQARGSGRLVVDLVVGGRPVVKDGKVVGIDEDAVTRELKRDLVAATPGLQKSRAMLGKYQDALRKYYLGGCHCHANKS